MNGLISNKLFAFYIVSEPAFSLFIHGIPLFGFICGSVGPKEECWTWNLYNIYDVWNIAGLVIEMLYYKTDSKKVVQLSLQYSTECQRAVFFFFFFWHQHCIFWVSQVCITSLMLFLFQEVLLKEFELLGVDRILQVKTLGLNK